MKLGFTALIVGSLFSLGAKAQAPDCALGKRYLDLAEDRIKAFAVEEAAAFLRQSLDVCPQYDTYQQLGELAAKSPDREARQQAVDAFVSAAEIAPNDGARAHTIYTYASLLKSEGDPQNAYALIKQAQALAPSNAEIAALARELDGMVQNPTEEHFRNALKGTLFKPLTPRTTLASGSGSGSGNSRPQPPPAPSARAINVRLNFLVGSTSLDEQSRPNIARLATALSGPEFANDQFVFVGHADSRGDGARNRELSIQRAEAIYRAMVQMVPALENRVTVVGRGEDEPIAFGDDERSYRENRRLQVLLK